LRLLIVTGLPATGKTTLATALASRYQLPLLAKDRIKESLLSAAAAADATQSRRLSDLSFARLFTEYRQLALAGSDVILEGNFRSGRHESALGAQAAARIAQVLCRVDETERRRRIAARAHDPARHRGHGDALAARDASNDSFLELPGERLLFDGGDAHGAGEALLLQLDRWWNEPAAR
jgi:predicted kinase